MATEKKPVKGILKASSSFDKPDLHPTRRESKETKWDEMNILATHHPPGKDYGHMKIDEPPTPYSKYSDQEDEENDDEHKRRGSVGESDEFDPDNLSSRLKGDNEPSVLRRHPSTGSDSSSEDETETDEERAKRKVFEQKRKLHYNEFQAVKLAKQLMEEEDEDEDENDDMKGGNADSQDTSKKLKNSTVSQSDSSQLQKNVVKK